jgi:glutathione S-transferase
MTHDLFRHMKLYDFPDAPNPRRVRMNTIGNVASHTDELFKDRVVQVPAFASTQREAAAAKWAWLDSELDDGRAFIAGDSLTVADITGAAASWLGEYLRIEIPASLAHVRRWDERIRSRPSWAA